MTNQEIFDTVYEGLKAQGCGSANSAGCAYKGENGTKCAVGWLIPDEVYTEDIESTGIRCQRDRASRSPTEIETLMCDLGYTSSQLDLLSALQTAHDCATEDEWAYAGKSTFIQEFLKHAIRVASNFGIQFPKENA